MMLDLKVWKKTVKVIMQIVALMLIACVMVLLVTSFCQQMVYHNTGLDRNAYVEVFKFVVGRSANEEEVAE